MFSTPILFLVFNRLETTQKVFEQIRATRPTRLYVAADGPRRNREDDFFKCSKVKEYILNSIDWSCDVKTLFREENLGCGVAVNQAIDWFFENEEEGIILEDDCLAHPTFFTYCESLLDRYRLDEKVMLIGGGNFQNGKKQGESSYYFSCYPHTWGWATWRSAWQNNSFDLKKWSGSEVLSKIAKVFSNNEEVKYWQAIYMDIKYGVADIWDYQWTISIWMSDGMVITPIKNLVINIGYGEDATHTGKNMEFFFKQQLESMEMPLVHSIRKINTKADRFTFLNHFNIPMRLSNRLRNIAYSIFPAFIFEKWRSLKSKMLTI